MALAQNGAAQTLIFDEADVGVGGAVAALASIVSPEVAIMLVAALVLTAKLVPDAAQSG